MQTMFLDRHGRVVDVSEQNGLPVRDLDRSMDLHNRLRVANKQVVYSHVQSLFRDDTLWDTFTAGTGDVSWSSGYGGNVLTVSALGDVAIRQGKIAVSYVEGLTLNFEIATLNFKPEVGVRKRVGKGHTNSDFSHIDGIFLETDDTYIYLRSYKDSTLTYESRQDEWIDPLDGSGQSGINLAKEAIQTISGAFLLRSSAEIGFLINGKHILVDKINNSNASVVPYLRSPYQPIHFSIQRVSGSGTATLFELGSSESYEGQDNTQKRYRDYVYNVGGVQTIQTTSNGVLYPLQAVMNTAHFAPVALDTIKLSTSSSESFVLSVRRDPVFSGTAMTYVDTGFGYKVGYAATNGSSRCSGGQVVHQDEIVTAAGTPILFSFNNVLMNVGTQISLDSSILVLCVQPSTNNMVTKSKIVIKSAG